MRHPLVWGAAWATVFTALIVVAGILDWPTLAWSILVLVLVAPSLAATIIVLSVTPRDHLHDRTTVFGHFFVRYLTLVLAFMAWSASVVLGAVISTSIQLAAEGDDEEVASIGFDLMAALTPAVVAVLWGALIVRCVWFLGRLRGWREAPEASEVPATLFAGAPALRRVVIGLAHPGLLLATGLASTVTALIAAELELYVVL
ncbi:hypothetical protein [Agromyces bauzanensis]|uniref:Uncharacterized protein n=1 Tax=Agromyces bauzanensis TaxID=1308924 RepID=A0A917UNH3_9MICO|nr:hypothetical protein [Agromyces bauzanensis]GGJ70595.1 hypothetical protein GCM10011372_05620 [Agromyces bauzanensis]